MNVICIEPSLKEGQTYPGEITREEAERLTRSAVFCIAGLEHWADYKPLFIYYEELALLDDFDWDVIADLEDRGRMPEPLWTTCPDEYLVYQTRDIEVCRQLDVTQSQTVEEEVPYEHGAAFTAA